MRIIQSDSTLVPELKTEQCLGRVTNTDAIRHVPLCSGDQTNKEDEKKKMNMMMNKNVNESGLVFLA